MKRKLAVAGILCLAVVALLGIGAAPAAAATCVDCHAAPGGPPSPACGGLVAGVDCATCHKAMSPHGTEYATPGLGLRLEGDTLKGTLAWPIHIPFHPWVGPRERVRILGLQIPIPNVVVYLQQRLWGTSDWIDLTQVITSGVGPNYSYTLASPTPGAAYRAVAEGGLKSEGVVRMPVKTVWLPTPTLTLTLSGLTNGSIAPGQSVAAAGTAAPTLLAGENVTVTAFRLQKGAWVKKRAGTMTLDATGAYEWTYSPRLRGAFKVHAVIAATDNHTVVTTPWRYFKVK